MKTINNILFKESPHKAVSRRNTLDEIHHHLEEYCNYQIPLQECISKSGALTVDLVADHYSDEKVSIKAYDNLLTLVINYYVILHFDNFAADFTVDKNHAFTQSDKISKEVISEALANKKYKIYGFRTLDQISKDFLQQLIDIYYLYGTQGCLKYLISSIYSILLLENKKQPISRYKIEEIIRSIQAEKFLDLFHPDAAIWS